ncbi:MAG: hypothetical protein JXA78_10855 [Anaerolineales bacterium]|nr:hypothetical protein [Anaerolineales bacterium]
MKSVNSSSRRSKGRFHRPYIQALSLLALFALLIPVSSTAQGASSQQSPDAPLAPPPGWTLDYVEALPNLTNMTNRSLDFKVNIPCIAFGGDHLYYSCYNKTTKKWGTPTIVDSDFRVGEYAALDFNTNNQPFISYYDAANARLKLAYNLGAGWVIKIIDSAPAICPKATQPEEAKERPTEDLLNERMKPWLPSLQEPAIEGLPALLPNDPHGVGKYASIDIDHLNRVHFSYYDECYGTLKYAFWDTGTYLYTRTIDEDPTGSDEGKHTSIVVDKKDKVHISYMSEKYDQLRYIRGSYPYNTASRWTKPMEVEARASQTGAYTAIGLINRTVGGVVEEFPHIIYFDWGNEKLKHAVLNAYPDVWGSESVIPGTNNSIGWFCSLKVYGNTLYVSYYDATNKTLKYIKRGSGGWSTITSLATATVDYFSSVGFSKAGNPGIAYFDADRGELRYIFYDGDKWIAPKVISLAGDIGLSSSLVLNSTGEAFISYFDIALGRLKYARSFGDDWLIERILNKQNSGAFSSIDLITEQRPQVAFYQGDATALWSAILKKNATWDITTVDSYYEVGEFVSMELDSNDDAHISYYDATHRDLRYALWKPAASEWFTDTLDHESEDIGLYTSLALDGADNPHISYYDVTNGDLKYIYHTGIGWGVPATVDDSTDNVGLYTSIALNSLGVPHISYYDNDGENLKFAVQSGLNWTKTELDTTGAVGMYTSMAIDPTDNSRHICYYDSTHGNLKYAEWTGAWTIYVMDNVGDVGVTCSIALAPGDKVGISYYDYSGGDLKFAHNYPMPPPPVIQFLPLIIN